ncbi:MAG: transcriptional regulator [Thermoproteota archaeon]|nr:transcriptional regulator [Thermoproteota archaeon]
MIVDLTFLGSDLVISGIFAFLVGMTTVMVYTKVKSMFRERRYNTDDTIVEAIVLEYTRRLQDYDKVIAELRSKVDIMEARAQAHTPVSQQPSHPQPHVAPMTGSVTVTQHAPTEMEGNGTTDYILKLLSERPRTSREVQLSIGRTREHTARLMKKLHDLGLVSRDINTKPFRYNITDVGQETLKERAGAASIAV